jgi:hypothetical protein
MAAALGRAQGKILQCNNSRQKKTLGLGLRGGAWELK